MAKKNQSKATGLARKIPKPSNTIKPKEEVKPKEDSNK